MYSRLNRTALDYYLRGEGGTIAQLEAQQELVNRGRQQVQQSISDFPDDEIAEYLREHGWVVFKRRQPNYSVQRTAEPLCQVCLMPLSQHVHECVVPSTRRR